MQTMRHSSLISYWLFTCALLVAVMVAVGGLTRLTESGLSIVEWKPLTGIFPPIGATAWEAEFSAYQTSPQYLKVNKFMSLAEFQSIFWLEYIHRLLGRIVGLVLVIPLILFALKRSISKPLALTMFGVTVLVGIQGAVGWYMVKSGLVHNPWVSPLRLAFHLGLAFVIFAIIWWQFLSGVGREQRDTSYPQTTNHKPLLRLQRGASLVTLFILLQTMLGALVAGLDAGLSYNTFPLMDGMLVPEGLTIMQPLYVNFFENVTMVQFNHRIGAYILSAVILCYVYMGLKHTGNQKLKQLFLLLLAVFAIQFMLGVLTLIKAVPLLLASLHQCNALLLFAVAVTIQHRLRGCVVSEESSLVGTKP